MSASHAAALLAEGRALAESLMVDRCTIRRRTGTTTDMDTGDTVDTYTTLYSDQPCRLQTQGNWGREAEAGQASVVVLTAQVQLPIAVTGLQVDDQILPTVCVHDPDQVGRVLRIRDMPIKSHATARRVMVEEVTG